MIEAVKASCGKVWPGQGRLRHGSRGLVCRVWASRGLVSQSCLGTFRRGAVKFGEARQSGQVMVLCGLARSGGARRGSHGSAMIGKFRKGTLGLGSAVKVLRGMSRLSEERLVKARLSKASRVLARRVSRGAEHQPLRKEAQCQHLQTSIHIVRDLISKSLRK